MNRDDNTGTTLPELLESRARSHPGRIFAVLESAEIRYGDFKASVDRVAASLHALGVARGDRVVCTLPNGSEMLYTLFAVARLGAVNVFINPQYDAELFGKVARSVEPRAYILDAENMAKARHLALPGARVVGGQGQPVAGELAYASLLAGNPAQLPPARVQPGDPFQYIFTSGTTGLPKACILSHHARLSLSEHVVRLFGATDEDRFFGCLPNYHGNLYFAIFGALLTGGSFALAERFHASQYWEQVRRFQATLLILHAVPMNILLAAPVRDNDSHHPARGVLTVGGRFQEFGSRFGLNTVMVSYGATEVGLTALGVLPSWTARNTPASYAGRVRDDHEVRIVRENGSIAARQELGEIQVRARVPFTIFSGYHTPQGRQGSADGLQWYRTNDLGMFDEQGVLHFHGRRGESVRVKGEFVPVEYLESMIRRHPLVEDCAVLGVASELGDQDLVVFVQKPENPALSGEELVEFLLPRVPKFMLPKRVEFLVEFPRTPSTLKVQKNRLLAALCAPSA